jgi:hypothetical protein
MYSRLMVSKLAHASQIGHSRSIVDNCPCPLGAKRGDCPIRTDVGLPPARRRRLPKVYAPTVRAEITP